MEETGISVGRHTYGHTAATFLLYAAGECIEVGAFCSIGVDARIFGGGEHDYRAPTTFPVRSLLLGRDDLPDALTKGPTRIGSDVYIGYGATVLSGVTVGDGAVIGARAVVAKDVRPYAIVVGNPARELKRRFDDATVDRLRALEWWTWPDEAVLELGDLFAGRVEPFLERAEAMAAAGVTAEPAPADDPAVADPAATGSANGPQAAGAEAALDVARAERDAAVTQLAAVRATRAWRLVMRYWSLRGRLSRS